MVDRDIYILISALGAFFLGAVYLGVVGAASIAAHSRAALVCVILSAGVGYLVQVGSVVVPEMRTALVVGWVASIMFGVLAGLIILWSAI